LVEEAGFGFLQPFIQRFFFFFTEEVEKSHNGNFFWTSVRYISEQL
jgi:hypothetical protein